MQRTYSISTLRRKATKAGYTLSKGYQRYHCNPDWGFCRDVDGNKIVGYMLYNDSTGFYEWPSYTNLWDYNLSLEDLVLLMKELEIL